MAKTKFPKTTETPSTNDFSMEDNPNAVLGVQANESFMLRAKEGRVLGGGGETMGFAKYQFGPTGDVLDLVGQEFQTVSMKYAELSTNQDTEEFRAIEKQYKELKARSEAPYNVASSSGALYKNKNQMQNDPTLGGDRALLTRAVASKKVDDLLGMNSIAQEKFGADSQGRPIGISVQVDGQGFTSSYEKKDCLLGGVDLKDSDIQRGLSDLEVQDYITGQIDRHAGNIFIDPVTKKVTGIDNDLAFPEEDREVVLANHAEARQKSVSGMPRMMHEETAARILNTKPDDLRKALKEMPVPNGVGNLSDASIEGAVTRLQNLQGELRKNPGSIQVVSRFDETTYKTAIDQQNPEIIKVTSTKDEPGSPATPGRPLDKLSASDSTFMVAANKTSYLSAMVIQEKRHMLNMADKADMMGIRPPDMAKQALRSPGFPGPDHPQFSAFQRMSPDDKLRFLGAQQGVVDLKVKAQRIETTIKNLSNNPSGWEKFKAVFQGGIQAKIGKLDKQVVDIEKQINNQNENVTKLVDKYEPKVPIPAELQNLAADQKFKIAADKLTQQQGLNPKDLQTALQTPALNKALMEFAKKEFSSENLEFHHAVDDFKKLAASGASIEDLRNAAQDLNRTFVTVGSPKQINISAQDRSKLQDDLSNLSQSKPDEQNFETWGPQTRQGFSEVFDQTDSTVLKVVKEDTFKRFKDDRSFKDAVTKLAEPHLPKVSETTGINKKNATKIDGPTVAVKSTKVGVG